MSEFGESEVEVAALAWVESLGLAVKLGPEISPGAGSGRSEDRSGTWCW
jgi:hypothetical protein